ncbi:MAG: saccharopine dehydrogenase C-terminal domain-containing protein [Anaerovoracaceae bacterium]|jgi:lysine 6-dehydrogenase
MKTLIIGSGLQGRVVGYDILKYVEDAEVIYADIDPENLATTKEFIKDPRASFVEFNVLDTEETAALMRQSDSIVVCLPHGEEITHSVYRGLAAAGNVKAVFSDYWVWERHQQHQQALVDANVLAVPGMGIAPGFANICIGQLEHEFDQMEEGIIYVGGIPAEKGTCPLDYMEAFCLSAMLDMYITPSIVFEDGELVEKPPLTVFDMIQIPGHGLAEVFYTDGLCTLTKNMQGKGIKKLAETTLRWPGHIEKMRQLNDLGFFSTEEIEVNGVKVTPKDVSEVIFKNLWKKVWGVRDLTYLLVVGKGLKDGKYIEKSYELKTYSDDEAKLTSMELATAYPISIAAQMIAEDNSGLKGIVDPEIYFVGDKFHEMVAQLGRRGINVYEK